MNKILIVTPTYDQKLNVSYTMSIVNNILDLTRDNLVQLVPNLTGTLLVYSRNILLRFFLETDATHIMMIDADLGFEDGAIRKLLECDVDFVGGVYPSRKQNTFNCRLFEKNGKPIFKKEKKFLLKAEVFGAGFLLIKRKVIEDLYNNPIFDLKEFPVRDQGMPFQKAKLIFNTEVVNGEFYSEDCFFGKLLHDMGVETWVYPDIDFNHDGVMGNYQKFLDYQKNNFGKK